MDPIHLHRENNALLGDLDILVPAYPGSGHALLGNILLELGFDYFDSYTERLTQTGDAVPVEERKIYRSRLLASVSYDASRHSDKKINTVPRFVKTHLYSNEFHERNRRNFILLVRDPRDAIYSYYKWRLGFSEEGETDTFLEFLARPNLDGKLPCEDWTAFHLSWMGQLRPESSFFKVSFENIKLDGTKELQSLLDFCGLCKGVDEIKRALEASSFNVMRKHEDNVSLESSPYRIMRRGIIGEWKEWYHKQHRVYFESPQMLAMARILGYELTNYPDEDL